VVKRDNIPAGANKPLTRRETEILRLIAKGSSMRQIAKMLFISWRTVDTHRIRNKTGCRNTAELTRYAMENGVLAAAVLDLSG